MKFDDKSALIGTIIIILTISVLAFFDAKKEAYKESEARHNQR